MRALLLGKPLHGGVRKVDAPVPERITIEVNVIEESKECRPGQCAAISPRRSNKVVYHRVRDENIPGDWLVYRRRDYEPQEDDLALAWELFG